VWFGFDAKVLAGSTVGSGSIVAAGAVVTGGEFPPYSVIAGVPATVVRTRTS
jgi:acetyltransferase-like isoleucine patch superfamily enzyme